MLGADFPFQSCAEIAASVRNGEIGAVELVAAMLARIEALDSVFRSYAFVSADRALVQASLRDEERLRGAKLGPLHGVPIAVKDLFDTSGIPTLAGMPDIGRSIPTVSSTVVARLEAAGAVLVGKLQMTEGAFAEHHPNIRPPLNPWAQDRWVGSSSSGSGVATAAGLCYASLGTDTGGSIRFPSAANGVTGLKPTWGRVSRHGVFPLAPTMDHVGPITRSASDAALMLNVIAGWDPCDPTTLSAPVPDYLAEICQSLEGVRVGIDDEYSYRGVDDPICRVVEAMVKQLCDLGAEIVRIRMPPMSSLLQGWIPLCSVEAAIGHRDIFHRSRENYGPSLKHFIDSGLALSAMSAMQVMHDRLEFSGSLDAVFQKTDLLLTPALPCLTPTLLEFEALMTQADAVAHLLRFAAPFSMSGHPTLSLPCGLSPEGLPIGGQLIGRRLDEGLLLRAGHLYQAHTSWHKLRPPICHPAP